jgi:hypothetical protein
MIEELKYLLEDFPGPANRSRCFTHILNLVVKSIMKEFDLPQFKKDGIADAELFKLAEDIEKEEAATIQDSEDTDDDVVDDNVEGWVDERFDMSEEELEELDEAVKPIRFLLTKVDRLSM